MLAKRFKHQSVVNRFVELEDLVFKTVKAVSVDQALARREYLYDLSRLDLLTKICNERRNSFIPTSTTAYDDRAVCTQLESDLFTIQMKVKMFEENQPLLLKAPKSSKTKISVDAPHTDPVPAASIATDAERTSPVEAIPIETVVPEAQLAANIPEDISLANVDNVISSISTAINQEEQAEEQDQDQEQELEIQEDPSAPLPSFTLFEILWQRIPI